MGGQTKTLEELIREVTPQTIIHNSVTMSSVCFACETESRTIAQTDLPLGWGT